MKPRKTPGRPEDNGVLKLCLVPPPRRTEWTRDSGQTGFDIIFLPSGRFDVSTRMSTSQRAGRAHFLSSVRHFYSGQLVGGDTEHRISLKRRPSVCLSVCLGFFVCLFSTRAFRTAPTSVRLNVVSTAVLKDKIRRFQQVQTATEECGAKLRPPPPISPHRHLHQADSGSTSRCVHR